MLLNSHVHIRFQEVAKEPGRPEAVIRAPHLGPCTGLDTMYINTMKMKLPVTAKNVGTP
jgi:hypothetical protein